MFAPYGAAADWNQWRGPERTDVSTETGLLKAWPKEGPRLAWLFKETGIGYSGFAVVGDRLYTMGARGDKEELIAIDTKEGKERWAAKVGDVLDNGWGNGPRGTPTGDGELVYALGGSGSLICAQTSDGKLLWTRSLKDVGGKVPDWGYTESVLVDGGKVVCTPGGNKSAIAACDVCMTIAPETFVLDGEAKATVRDPEGNPREVVIAAAANCPTGAITVHDGDSGEQLVPASITVNK